MMMIYTKCFSVTSLLLLAPSATVIARFSLSKYPSFLSVFLFFPLATICIHADVAVFAVRGLTIQSSNFCQRAAFVERYQLKPKKSLYRAGGSSSAGIEPGGNGQ